MPNGPADTLRLAEILAPLSLVMDLGRGQPAEESMAACLLATGLARRMELPESEVATVYYTTLLRHLGCTATAHEEAAVFGDELATRPTANRTDFTRPAEMLAMMRTARALAGTRTTARMLVRFSGSRGRSIPRAICEVAGLMADRLDLGPGVQEGVYQSFERWDGKGDPHRLKEEAICPAARYSTLASQAMAFHHVGGADLALAIVGKRSGGWFDPGIAQAFLQHGRDLIEEIESTDAMVAVIEGEPEPHRQIPDAGIDRVAGAFADMIDLKTPFTHGHSPAVAELAVEAGRRYGLSEGDLISLRRAALLHDLGRVGVPAGTWERPGALTGADWERVRLHAYHTERILARAEALTAPATIAGMHHERMDGSGYHRQAKGSSIPAPARVLAAADACQAMSQDRPHRPALDGEAAAAQLVEGMDQGLFDADAARAVLEAVGHVRARPRPRGAAGLSEREVEVLRLMTRGLSNPEIGRRLFISPRTAEHHVQHIYTKIGVSTRAGAAVFAMHHDLLPT